MAGNERTAHCGCHDECARSESGPSCGQIRDFSDLPWIFACPSCEALHGDGLPARPGCLRRVCQHWRRHMLHSVLSAIALAGVLAAAHPALADPAVATAAGQTQPAAPSPEQPAPPAPARTPSPDAPAPAGAGLGRNIIFAGFGWGQVERKCRPKEEHGHDLYCGRLRAAVGVAGWYRAPGWRAAARRTKTHTDGHSLGPLV
jgi:hypothetical protein